MNCPAGSARHAERSAMKEYLMLLVISMFLAHNVGTAYGEYVNALYGELTAKLDRVQVTLR
ncbi:hypothetical protein [Azohydromonas caseinilytica]|uniref:Uncharacterized protein n=1 Tax=Azohydromonas caseinilytica TaxID=2728836 RepID=A0A848FIQ2_9BURK|nr:hypothetical protein [Azohydromonas caseinilytica]NML17721.1 hypothetical protein [Azohydromonas caseinilytica]